MLQRSVQRFTQRFGRRFVGSKARSLFVGEKVFRAPANMTVKEASYLMTSKNIGCLIIAAEDNTCLGLITERDVLKYVGAAGEADYNPDIEVGSFMTDASKLVTLTLDDNLASAIVEMENRNIRHIPITEGSKIVGVESIRGAMRKIISQLEAENEALENYESSDGESDPLPRG